MKYEIMAGLLSLGLAWVAREVPPAPSGPLSRQEYEADIGFPVSYLEASITSDRAATVAP